MRKENGSYNVYVLGKNGEPRADVNLNVNILHKNVGPSGQMDVVLTTDKEGKVKLGHLKKIMAVNVASSFLGLHGTWFIGNQMGGEKSIQNLLTYPSSVDVIEGETLEFPVTGFKNKSRKNASLIKLWSPSGSSQIAAHGGSQKIVLEDLFDKIQIISGESDQEDQKKDYSLIKLNNLQEGTYKLKIKKVSKTILITVHRGQYWDQDTFILKRNCLFENRAPLKMIKLSSVKVADDGDSGKQKVTIKVEDYS